MSIKLIAVDLDDTLLDKTVSVSPRTRDVIRQAIARGIVVTIATGRMFCSAARIAGQLELDIPIITYNGAMIKSCLSEEVLYHQPIENALALRVLHLFRERGWYIQAYVDDTLYVEKINDKTQNYEKLSGVTAQPAGDRLYTLTGRPTKLLSIADPDAIGAIWRAVEEHFPGKLYIAQSKAHYLEMAHPDVNKGRALAFLADKLGIARDEVMAVGDSINDLDMIQYAGWGVAMGNARESVKAVAQAVTLRNDEDGVAEAILKYALSNCR
jgi:Cof subfamily protein (haloacid dehalogenase superfamily)